MILLKNMKKYNDDNEELKKGGNPADCIACRACEKHCPQKIQIVDELKKVVELFK